MERSFYNFRDIHMQNESTKIDIVWDRPKVNLQQAQLMLDLQVINDMKPYMPLRTGNFIQRTSASSIAISGSGEVIAGAPPYGRFLYYGKVMVGVTSGSAYAMEGEKKVATFNDLKFNKEAHPKAVKQWFEVAKVNHRPSWVRLVKRIGGGGL